MLEKTGRKLEVGQVVDVLADGILSAIVVEIREGGLVGADGRIEPALLVIQIGIPIRLAPGDRAPVYIVRASDRPQGSEGIQ